jgi:hypothetical protein
MALLVNIGTTRPATTVMTKSTTSRPSAMPSCGQTCSTMPAAPRPSTSAMKNRLRRLPDATSGCPMPQATATAKNAPATADAGSDTSASARASSHNAAIAASAPPVGVGRPVHARTAVSRKPDITANA